MSKTRKGFLEPKGFTCNNWYNSWSFINYEKKIVCFTGWIDYEDEEGKYKIFDTAWGDIEQKNGHLYCNSPGYKQAIEHIKKIESGDCILQILKTEAIKTNVVPRKVKEFWPVMRTCSLIEENGIYYAKPIKRNS